MLQIFRIGNLSASFDLFNLTGVITTTNGSSLVRVGNTTVVCGIKAEVSVPKQSSAKEGYLVPNVELSPMCSPKFKPGPPGEQAQVLSENLDRLLKRY